MLFYLLVIPLTVPIGMMTKPDDLLQAPIIAETDKYWDAITGNGGEPSECGWCRDRWGFSWQITPRVLLEGNSNPDPAVAKRVFDAMMTMHKIDVAKIEAAVAGETANA